jgi:hypothetical protein
MYYEAHVTIEPVFGTKLRTFKAIARDYKFRVADLFLQKRSEDKPERSRFDSFCTGRGTDYDELKARTVECVLDLHHSGFDVWRYKIEKVLLDEREPMGSKGMRGINDTTAGPCGPHQ